MTRRPVALIAGALLTLLSAGCWDRGEQPEPATINVVTTSPTPTVVAVLLKQPTNAGELVDVCEASPCTFMQTAAELEAQPAGYYVTVVGTGAAGTFKFTCSSTDVQHDAFFAAETPGNPAQYVAFCVYDDGVAPPPPGVDMPGIDPGTTTTITVTYPPATP